jgi:hypothetical protein
MHRVSSWAAWPAARTLGMRARLGVAGVPRVVTAVIDVVADAGTPADEAPCPVIVARWLLRCRLTARVPSGGERSVPLSGHLCQYLTGQ